MITERRSYRSNSADADTPYDAGTTRRTSRIELASGRLRNRLSHWRALGIKGSVRKRNLVSSSSWLIGLLGVPRKSERSVAKLRPSARSTRRCVVQAGFGGRLLGFSVR